MVKISDHGEENTPWVTWEHHRGVLNHFENLQNSKKGTWTGSREYFGEDCSVSQPLKTRDEMQISPTLQEPRYEPTYSKYIRVESYVVHKVPAGGEHQRNS
jgi:hypothetical protein